MSAARELRDEENAQISVKDLDQLIGTAPTVHSVGTRRAALSQQPADNQHISTHHPTKRPYWWAAAACLLGFLAGFGMKSALPSGNSLAVVPSSGEEGLGVVAKTNTPTPATPADTILLREVVHDTVYQTRVILRDIPSANAVTKAVAKAEPAAAPIHKERTASQEATGSPTTESETVVGCSMLCDDIPYAFLAHN